MYQNSKQLSEDLIKKAKLLGASAAEATVVKTESLSIEVKSSKLEKIETANMLDVGIRVFFNSQSACVSISSTSNEDLDKMVFRAIEMAKEATPDNFSIPAEKNQLLVNWNENDLHSVQGRICKPEEVASAVLYLASDESSFVNGTALYVDNGWYAKG